MSGFFNNYGGCCHLCGGDIFKDESKYTKDNPFTRLENKDRKWTMSKCFKRDPETNKCVEGEWYDNPMQDIKKAINGYLENNPIYTKRGLKERLNDVYFAGGPPALLKELKILDSKQTYGSLDDYKKLEKPYSAEKRKNMLAQGLEIPEYLYPTGYKERKAKADERAYERRIAREQKADERAYERQIAQEQKAMLRGEAKMYYNSLSPAEKKIFRDNKLKEKKKEQKKKKLTVIQRVAKRFRAEARLQMRKAQRNPKSEYNRKPWPAMKFRDTPETLARRAEIAEEQNMKNLIMNEVMKIEEEAKKAQTPKAQTPKARAKKAPKPKAPLKINSALKLAGVKKYYGPAIYKIFEDWAGDDTIIGFNKAIVKEKKDTISDFNEHLKTLNQ